jgi:hypothetical protein
MWQDGFGTGARNAEISQVSHNPLLSFAFLLARVDKPVRKPRCVEYYCVVRPPEEYFGTVEALAVCSHETLNFDAVSIILSWVVPVLMARWAVDEHWRGIDNPEHGRVILKDDVALDGLGTLWEERVELPTKLNQTLINDSLSQGFGQKKRSCDRPECEAGSKM